MFRSRKRNGNLGPRQASRTQRQESGRRSSSQQLPLWSHPKCHLQLVVSQEQTCHLREREEEVRSQEQPPKGAKGTSQVEARLHAGLPNKACPLALTPPQAAAVQIEEMDEGGRPDTPELAVGVLTQSCHLPSFPVMLGPGGLQLQRHVMASESCLLGGSLREKTEASGCPLSPRNPESCGPAAHTGSPPVGEAASAGQHLRAGVPQPTGTSGECFQMLSPALPAY